MNISNSFLSSLVNYTWKRAQKLPVNWWYVGTAATIIVMTISAVSAETSLAWVKTRREVVEKAVSMGDYKTAAELLNVHESQMTNEHKLVLGADAELEELLYPERKVEREIAKYEELNLKYPGSRDILLSLSALYKAAGNVENATNLMEEARILDPNNEIFR